jgi:uroporphyrinogen-III synthase
MATHVIVTSPLEQGDGWLAGLRGAGQHATSLPLIEIRALPLPWPVLGAGAALEAPSAVMFVSAAAARTFFSSSTQHAALRDSLRLGRLRVWVTGPGSAQALLQAGVPTIVVDSPAPDAAGFDSQTLWAVVSAQVRAGFVLLVVRGRDALGGALGRPWLAEQVGLAGGAVAQLVAYERALPQWSAQQRAWASAAASDGSLWLFSSSQSVAHLLALLPGQSWRGARALATHARIADAARAAGFGVVAQARPSLVDVLASIESSDESGDSNRAE